jgi:hypothetical protein
MGEERKPKQFLEARPEGRRPRGRPRKSYEDGIEEIGRRKGKSLREMRRLAVNGGRWKEFIEAPLPNTVRHHGEKKEEEELCKSFRYCPHVCLCSRSSTLTESDIISAHQQYSHSYRMSRSLLYLLPHQYSQCLPATWHTEFINGSLLV